MATVLRIDPLRVKLTVPALFVAEVAEGRTVTLDVDAYPGERFSGQVRFVSPALDADSRALVVEAEIANRDGRLKPGFFATARIEQATSQNAVMVPSAAIRTIAGTPRVFVIAGDAERRRAEERVIAIGEVSADKTEVTSGVKAGETIVASGLENVVDGVPIITVPR